MIGYDFNGVVDIGRFRPTNEDVIITGNTLVMVPSVLNWLTDNGLQCAVYFMPDVRLANNRNAVAVWKSDMVRRLRCEKFYEDDPIQYEIIKDSCPDCEVIKV